MARPNRLLCVSGLCLLSAALLAALLVYDLIPGRNWLNELEEQGRAMRTQTTSAQEPAWVRIQ